MTDATERPGLGSIADPTTLLEGFFEHSPVAFQVYEADGHSLVVNQAFRDLFGSEPPPEYNILQDEIAERAGFLDLIRRAFQGETVSVPPHWYDPRELQQVKVPEGNRVGIQVTLFPLRDASGRVRHVALCIKDVTAELKRYEAMEALARSDARKAAVIEGALDCIITMDGQGRITEFNPAAERTFGYSRDDALGKPLADLIIPPALRKAHRDGLKKFLATGAGAVIGKRVELSAIRADGSEFPVELIVTTVPSDGDPVFTGFVRDLTERKQAQEAMERMREEREEQLRASIRVRDDFLATAGHELKTPLAALLMQLQGLQRAAGKEAVASMARRLEKAVASGLRLDRLINQLLDVSRITAGRLRLEPESLNLSDVVQEVVTRFAEPNGKPGYPIELRCDPAVNGFWDRLRIDQVVNNLVGNAMKYGQGKPVEIDLHLEDSEAVVRVVDHGIGIDEDHQKKIFQRFERAVATRDFGGFGLGLWISRQIVEASGGKIDVHSAPGEGAAFTVRLPTNHSAESSEVRRAG